ncbi:TlpA disulfide reductase family protein [Pseudovibrio sp. JE062]|uniref:TlpA family protein disulfide reductase n=1 Tax=Pseudovibrio sp. JE062 TaxID=439495 RepID=UPI001AD8CA3D|nr:TlpA disulfide reductase family protein [Pseudovibrio sp. JE062]
MMRAQKILLTSLFLAVWALISPVSAASFEDPKFSLELRDANGTKTLGEAFTKGPAILHFWATWCPNCRVELPAMERFEDELKAQGLDGQFVVVALEDVPYGRIQSFLQDRLGLERFTSYQAVDMQAMGTAFQVAAMPYTIFLDENGGVLGGIPGSLEWDAPQIRETFIGHLQGKGTIASGN